MPSHILSEQGNLFVVRPGSQTLVTCTEGEKPKCCPTDLTADLAGISSISIKLQSVCQAMLVHADIFVKPTCPEDLNLFILNFQHGIYVFNLISASQGVSDTNTNRPLDNQTSKCMQPDLVNTACIECGVPLQVHVLLYIYCRIACRLSSVHWLKSSILISNTKFYENITWKCP